MGTTPPTANHAADIAAAPLHAAVAAPLAALEEQLAELETQLPALDNRRKALKRASTFDLDRWRALDAEEEALKRKREALLRAAAQAPEQVEASGADESAPSANGTPPTQTASSLTPMVAEAASATTNGAQPPPDAALAADADAVKIELQYSPPAIEAPSATPLATAPHATQEEHREEKPEPGAAPGATDGEGREAAEVKASPELAAAMAEVERVVGAHYPDRINTLKASLAVVGHSEACLIASRSEPYRDFPGLAMLDGVVDGLLSDAVKVRGG